jgi:hypothetical protein
VNFPTGHIRDSDEVKKTRVGLHLHPRIGAAFGASASVIFPLSTNNRAKLPVSQGGPGVLNQTDTSTCEGHGWATVTCLHFALKGTPIPLPSPLGFYYGALLVSNRSNPDGTIAPLYDQGTTPSAIIQAMVIWGSCPATVWGQYPANSSTLWTDPSDSSSPMVPVKPEQLFAESGFKLKGAYFITSAGNQKILDLITALASGEILTNAIPASGPTFQRYKGGILGAVEGPVDHCNVVLDYAWLGTVDQLAEYIAALGTNNEDVLSALNQFIVFYGVNSWGEILWGESDVPEIQGGMYRAGRAFADQMEDLCVADLEKIAA